MSQQKLKPNYFRPEDLDAIKRSPFWIKDEKNHSEIYKAFQGECCFNHIIGLPSKHGRFRPLYDYQTDIILPAIKANQYTWILKATGLGITELILRLMAYTALHSKDVKIKNSHMCVIVGPNINLAKKLIARLKTMFYVKLGVLFDTAETKIILPENNVTIEAFPSHNVNAFRSLENVSMILVDEADFFPKGQQREVKDASERYVGKSDAKVIMVSTPNMPGGLMETIDRDDKSPYFKIRLDYTYGLDRIYSREDIEKAKRYDSFEREYNLKYLGKVGNVFSLADVDYAVASCKYEIGNYGHKQFMFPKALGVDPGFGSSPFGLCLTMQRDFHIEIILAEDYDRPSITDMIDRIIYIINEYKVTKVYIDAANPGFIVELKKKINDFNWKSYQNEMPALKQFRDPKLLQYRIVPVAFNLMHKLLLEHSQILMTKRCVQIHPTFDKLITSLKTAYAQDLDLDKEQTSYDDIFDAFRLAMINYNFEGQP